MKLLLLEWKACRLAVFNMYVHKAVYYITLNDFRLENILVIL